MHRAGPGHLPLHIVVAFQQNVPTLNSLVVLLELLIGERLLQAVEEAHRHGAVVLHSCEAATTAEGEGIRASEKAEREEYARRHLRGRTLSRERTASIRFLVGAVEGQHNSRLDIHAGVVC